MNGRAIAALLFMTGSMYGLDVWSAMHSSPWTQENMGADEAKARSAREYMFLALLLAEGFGISASIIGGEWWPFIGVTAMNGFMYFIYNRAINRGKNAGSTGWING